MKRWQIFMLILVITVTVFGCAEPAPVPTGTPTQEPAPVPTAPPTKPETLPSGVKPIDLEGLECLIQVHTQAGSLSGSDRDPNTYYAIRESGVEQVDVEAVKYIAPEMLDPESFDSDNEETSSWFVELMYAPRVENYDSEGFSGRDDPWVPTDFGENVRIILAGLSMGAATVLMSTDQPLPANVLGVVADCPYSSPGAILKTVCSRDMHIPGWLVYPFARLGARIFAGFDLEETSAVNAVKHTPVPILLLHGTGDKFVPCDMSREIRDANPDMITLVTIPEAGHGLCYMTEPKIYEDAMQEFFRKILN